MQITERIVSTKRHTIGYVVGGREYTRLQAAKLALKGKISNVHIRMAPVPHIAGDGYSLYDLPGRLGTSRRFAAMRSR